MFENKEFATEGFELRIEGMDENAQGIFLNVVKKKNCVQSWGFENPQELFAELAKKKKKFTWVASNQKSAQKSPF